MIQRLLVKSVVLFVMSLVACEQPTIDATYPCPDSNTEYELVDMMLLSEIDERECESFQRYWMTDNEENSLYSYVVGFYQPYLTCNFNPHSEKVYCWIDCVGDTKIRLSEKHNDWEGAFVVLSANIDVGRHVGDVWYTTTAVAFEGEKGNCEFYLRFYVPNGNKYLTTRKIVLTTDYGYYFDGEEGLEEYGRYEDKVNLDIEGE